MKSKLLSFIFIAGIVNPALANENSFITGGEKVNKGDFPWQVRILEGDDDQSGFCGGSIIAPKWVLTAAHCIEEYFADGGDVEDFDVPTPTARPRGDTEEEVFASKIYIGFGSNKLDELGTIEAEQMWMHPHYGIGGGPDVALIKLKTSLPNGLIIPIDRTNANYDNGTDVWVTGWGAQMDSNFDPTVLLLYNMANGKQIRNALDGSNISVPEELRFAQMKVVDHSKCVETYNGFNDVRMAVDEGEICVGSPGSGKDSCYGDSGGPLVVKNEDLSFTQIGIVSWGYQCGHPFFPGVYASTAAYADWIDDIIENN